MVAFRDHKIQKIFTKEVVNYIRIIVTKDL